MFALLLEIDDAVGDVQGKNSEQVFEVIGDRMFGGLYRFRFGE